MFAQARNNVKDLLTTQQLEAMISVIAIATVATMVYVIMDSIVKKAK